MIRRRIASTRIQTATSPSRIPFTSAARISTRRKPKVQAPPAGRAASEAATSANAEREGVGEHVPRVGEQRERGGDDAEGDLGRHQPEDQRERDPERAPVGAKPRVEPVIVAVMVHGFSLAPARAPRQFAPAGSDA